jgi:hypothetical protein
MQVNIKDLTGMLKEARCRAFKEEFTSADAVINFFEDKLISLCLERFLHFDISKFQEASRLKIQTEIKSGIGLKAKQEEAERLESLEKELQIYEEDQIYEEEPASGNETTNYDKGEELK